MPNFSVDEIRAIYRLPLFELLQKGRETFLRNWPEHDEVQLCKLMSIKTGGCSEDCGYCAQSAHFKTGTEPGKLLGVKDVLPVAEDAKQQGATRFCMGAAWKGIREDDPRFGTVVEIVRAVAGLGLEVCVTLGQIGEEAAQKLKDAGLTSYNHNLDTGSSYYSSVVTTHKFEDRVRTLRAVQSVGLALCCGGIIGMGEGEDDRLGLLASLTELYPHPESVPINCLVPIPGTPMENSSPVDVFDLVRMVATARVVLPLSKIRLAAGRSRLSKEAQALCFFAGANSVFYGDKLLTTPNSAENEDRALLAALGLKPQIPHG